MHFGLHPSTNMIMAEKKHICARPVRTFSSKTMNRSICDRLIGQPHGQTRGSLLTECWVSSSSSPSGWMRCLQPCLLMCPAKQPPSCSILFRRVYQQHVQSPDCLDPWLTAAQRTPTSSKLPALGAAPATPRPCSTEWSRNPQVVLHTPCPHRPGEQEGIASPGNTWNICRPQVFPHDGLTQHPQGPSFPIIQLFLSASSLLVLPNLGRARVHPVLPSQGMHVFSWTVQGFGFGLKLCLVGPFLQFWSGFSFPRICSPVQAQWRNFLL